MGYSPGTSAQKAFVLPRVKRSHPKAMPLMKTHGSCFVISKQDAFKKRVRENENTLFILVADECHWGALKDNVRSRVACTLSYNILPHHAHLMPLRYRPATLCSRGCSPSAWLQRAMHACCLLGILSVHRPTTVL